LAELNDKLGKAQVLIDIHAVSIASGRLTLVRRQAKLLESPKKQRKDAKLECEAIESLIEEIEQRHGNRTVPPRGTVYGHTFHAEGKTGLLLNGEPHAIIPSFSLALKRSRCRISV